jgi:hypothetical protein
MFHFGSGSGPISLNSATAVLAIATAESHTASTVASAKYRFRTPPGTYAITVIWQGVAVERHLANAGRELARAYVTLAQRP